MNILDEYIGQFPKDIQERLTQIRKAVKEIVPESSEVISYNIPTFKYKGKNLIHFAAFKNHIGLYPLPGTIVSFKNELSKYKQGKGSIQFQNDEPLPLDLIRDIVVFRKNQLDS